MAGVTKAGQNPSGGLNDLGRKQAKSKAKGISERSRGKA